MIDLGNQLSDAVSAAAAAYMSRLAAEKAAPGGKSQFFPGNLGAVGSQNINIKKPSQTVLIFQRDHE